ncbi:tetratricopeptide repeat protein [Bacillus alkalicellulosilyticus]|uniref:tetratricopeptide repeat protein n=1 Tax=Alkalihalobacterium alkalicellulosilyticum TaxID=1912214 RepID=UPI00148321C0|nr:tetratricopeptide repeat protein [Bacillus alkalicellulosilyticus]
MKVSDRERTDKKIGTVIPFVKNADYLFDKGLNEYRKKNMKKAVFFLEKAIEAKEKDPDFYCQLAMVLAEIGEYERSNEQLQFVIDELDPSMDECYFFMANNYAHLGFFEQAEKMAHMYLEKNPMGDFYEDTLELLELLEFEREDSGLYQDAEGEELFILKYDQARTHIDNGKFEEAIGQLEEIISDHPTFWAAYNHLAQALFNHGESNRALQLTDEVLEKDKGNLVALCNLAEFNFKLGNSEQVMSLVTMLRTVKPIDLHHRYKMANVLCKVGEYKLSYDYLVELRKLQYDESVEFYKCFAVAAYHCGALDKALSYWSKAAAMGDTSSKNIVFQFKQQTLVTEDILYT